MDTRPRSSRWKQGAAVVAIGTALAVGVVSPAEAAGPKTNSVTNAYTAPTPYAHLVGGIWSGAPVTMHCWVDNAWADGTNRWFLVTGAGWSPYTGRAITVHGYVAATRIVNQASVGHC